MAEENLEEEVETLDVEEADADDSEEQEELSDEELDRDSRYGHRCFAGHFEVFQRWRSNHRRIRR